MNEFLEKAASRVSKSVQAKIVMDDPPSDAERIKALEDANEQMQRDIDEIRADSLRIAELYDLVFNRLNEYH